MIVLDRARRRRAGRFRARRIWRQPASSACRSSTAPGRPPTRTRSSPAAIACSRSTRSTTARSPSTSCDTLAQQIGETPTDIVVFSDFRHGIFNRDTIPRLIDAIPASTFRVADSQVASRWGNILDFKGFDLITPNEREARFALGDQDSVVRPLGLELYEQAELRHADPQARRARRDDLPRRAEERRGRARLLRHRQLCRARGRRGRRGRRAARLRDARLVRHQEQRHRVGARLARRGDRMRARRQRAGRAARTCVDKLDRFERFINYQ